jgi:hypothetical protein
MLLISAFMPRNAATETSILARAEVRMDIFIYVAGWVTGVLTWWITERRVRQEPYQSRLAEFLLPLQDDFVQTKNIADYLRGELADLEFPHLKTYLESLPDTDLRKFIRRQRIDTIHALNSDAIHLITEKGGNSSSQLREALNEFRSHAMEWDDMWKAVNSRDVPAGREVRGGPFPQKVSEALEREIADTKRRAGRR